MFGIDDILIGAGIGGLGKLIAGATQADKASSLKEDNYIPPSALENKRVAEQQAGATTYAGQSADEARNNAVIANSVGNAQRNAKSAADVINSASNISAGLGSKFANQIGNRYQQFKQNALTRLMGANNAVAGYQNQNHQQYLNYKKQLEGASLQNFWGAANDLGGGIAANAYAKSSPYNYNQNFWE